MRNNVGIVRAIINLITVGLIVFAIVFVVNKFDKETKITNEFIEDKLEVVSELTSAKLTYTGIAKYEDGKVKFINKKSFSMRYVAEIRAGISVSDVDVKITEDKVKLILPEVDVLDVKINSDGFAFYDEKFSLFNREEKEDTVEAIKEAEKHAMENADIDKLKLEAKAQIETLFAGLFEGVIEDRTLEIEYK